jgi:hypothetical protein
MSSSNTTQLLPTADLLDLERKAASHFAPLLDWDNASNAEWPNAKLGERHQEACKSDDEKISFTFKWPEEETEGRVKVKAEDEEGGVGLDEEERGRTRTRGRF